MYTLPYKIASTTNLALASHAPFDVTTGFDNNVDGVFNDRPERVLRQGPGVYATHFGLLSTETVNGNLPRNTGVMPATIHLDLTLSRTFLIREKSGAKTREQNLRVDARSANIPNYANCTVVDGILGSTQFGLPITADFGRRIEFEARLSF